MINKIYKIINNKFTRLFKFVFFIRYLFGIFIVAIGLFLFIPQFFDYKNKEQMIKLFLSDNLDLKVYEMYNIKYKPLPSPHLQVENIVADFKTKDNKFKIKKLVIYPKIFNIYNYKKFKVKKIKIENSLLEIDFKNLNEFFLNNYKHKYKLVFKNLLLQIKDKNINIIDLEKINYINYGYKKNIIVGEIFNKKFKIKLRDNLSNINFKILNSGVTASLSLLKNKQINNHNGIFEGKILNSYFKFNFTNNKDYLKIKNFYFRDKNLSFNSTGQLDIKPFFKLGLKSDIKSFNPDILKNLNIDKILNSKDLIRRLNSQIEIDYQLKGLSGNLIKDFKSNLDLAFGRLNLHKKFFISDSKFSCKNIINLLEEFPILYFECSINSLDKKELLKKININYKAKNEKLDIEIKGSVNILNNKINFYFVKMNNTYQALEEDLKYFKQSFENILFDEGFMNIFDLSKIKKFVLEIS